MTLRLTLDEHELLRQRATEEGVSMQELARRAVREHLGLEDLAPGFSGRHRRS